jgi:cation transport regulator
MPYEAIKELPASARDVLPEYAQEIYRAAFNSAWDEYAMPERRRGSETREEAARKVAWAAVKQTYEKDDATGRWQLRPASPANR